MAKLIATAPCAKLLPLAIGDVEISEVVHQKITSVAPYKGRHKAVSEAMKVTYGIGLPAANRMTQKDDRRAMFAGIDQYLVLNANIANLSNDAAMTDQSDGWACVAVSGAGAEDVLARLVPIDLRRAYFRKGYTARTLLAHMTVSITRTDTDTFEIMVMRSMAHTLVHDLSTAAKGVAARQVAE